MDLSMLAIHYLVMHVHMKMSTTMVFYFSPNLLMQSSATVASSSDIPPDKKEMVGNAGGTVFCNTRTVHLAISCGGALAAWEPNVPCLVSINNLQHDVVVTQCFECCCQYFCVTSTTFTTVFTIH